MYAIHIWTWDVYSVTNNNFLCLYLGNSVRHRNNKHLATVKFGFCLMKNPSVAAVGDMNNLFDIGVAPETFAAVKLPF